MLRRLALSANVTLGVLMFSGAFADEQSEAALTAIQSAEISTGLPRVLQLARADMMFCEDDAAADELKPNDAESTTVRANAIRLANDAGLDLAPGVIEGTIDAVGHAAIKGYLSALERIEMSDESKKRFCDAAHIRLNAARQLRKEQGPPVAQDVRWLSSDGKLKQDLSRRLLSVFVDQSTDNPLEPIVRKPAQLESCGTSAAKVNQAKEARDHQLANLKNIFAEELQAQPNWPNSWLVAAQVHLLFAYTKSYSAGVANSLQALSKKERSKACKLAK